MAKDTRAAAALAISQLFRQQGSLASALPPLINQVKPQDKGLLQDLCYGSMRYFHRLNAGLQPLLSTPLKAKDQDILALLYIGAYQMEFSRVPAHAAVASCVDACRALKKPWASKLVNAILREYQRQMPIQLDSKQAWLNQSHPKWFYKSLENAWPEHFESILKNNNDHPPFTLRVNQAITTREDYLALLSNAGIDAHATPYSPMGITLVKPCSVDLLPHFSDGWASVQDEAAQLACELLQLEDRQAALDACCAPGGKTCHLLEAQKDLTLTAIDSEAKRLVRVEENLERLKLKAKLVCEDAGNTSAWWDGEAYDRILLDAPCSATGVIRRHPDIKLLRKPANIEELVEIQRHLLESLWACLKPGGILVYATCSVLPQENHLQIERFLLNNSDARELKINEDWGIATSFGRQLFPQTQGHDGFYYARVQKVEQ